MTRYLTHDTATAAFDGRDGGFDVDEQDVVRVDAPESFAAAFDTNEFVKVSDATIARPIEQPYFEDGDLNWYQKPAEELRKAAWSFDNVPLTLGHPDTGMVRSVDDIHGFWRNPRYDDGEDRLLADLYIPRTDDEARTFVDQHQDVSVGFYNRVHSHYDGDTGGLVDEDVDGYQVDLYGNHVAVVEQGRCSSEHGCGLDGGDHGTVHYAGLDSEHDMDLSVPDGAQEDAQSFLDAVEAGKVPDSCGGEDGTGRRRAEQFAEGGELSLETWVTGGTDAVANWHPRHEGNEDYDESEVDTPWEDCGYAMFKAWGGETARNKAARLKEQYEERTDSLDQTTSYHTQEEMTQQVGIDPPEWRVGDRVVWQANPDMRGEIVATDPSRKIVMVELMEEGGGESGYTLTAGYTDLRRLDQAEMDDTHTYNQGTMVSWSGGDARGEIVDSKTEGCFNERIDGDFEICASDGEPVYLIEEDDGKTVAHKHDTLTVESSDSLDCSCTTVDAPSGIYESEDGGMYAIAPDEHSDESTSHADDAKYPVNSCNDVRDAWNLRGNGDYSIDQSTLEARIKRAAEANDCPAEYKPWEDETQDNMSDNEDEGGFDIPDLSVDALAAKNDAVAELKTERDEARDALEERRERLDEAFDSADNFTIEVDEDECRCDAVEDLVAELDDKVAEVEDLREDLAEYRAEEVEDRLDTLAELGADRDEWQETADEADDPLAVLDEEIERREEVLDAVGADVSVKDVDFGTDSTEETADEGETTISGTRRFGRGHGA